MKEIWKDVKGYEGLYQVSNFGNVKSLIRNKILRLSYSHNGYRLVSLQRKTFRVHKLVAEAFIPNPNNYVCINHKNEDKTDNRVENLEWCSYQYNNTYNGKLEKLNKCKHKPIAQYDLKGNLIKKYKSITSASKELNISINSISNCLRGLSHKCYGYSWKYEKE